MEGPIHYVEDINFIYDLTYKQGEEEIHDMFTHIEPPSFKRSRATSKRFHMNVSHM